MRRGSKPPSPNPGAETGPPRSVTVYPAQDGWRFALATEKGSVLGGRYADLPPGAPAEEARLVAERTIQSTGREVFDLSLRVEWQPGPQPGWWDGRVVRAAGEETVVQDAEPT